MEHQRTDQQFTWRRTIRAAGLTLLLGILVQTAMAQADAWITANSTGTAGRWADLAPANPTVGAAVALPTPGGANGYAGQVPAYSQHIRTNGEGGIIFFAVDGVVYNGDGYRISDALGPDCYECRHPGTMEFLSVPVPGSCSLYYLFSAHPSNLGVLPPYGSMVQVSILDMSRFTYEGQGSETWDCTRPKGRLIGFDTLSTIYPQFEDWVDVEGGPLPLIGSLATDSALAADRVRSLWVGQVSAKGNSPQIRIVDGESPGDDAFLFFRTASTIRVYRITANGVFPVQQNVAPGPNNAHIVPLDNSFNNPLTAQPYHVDTDVRRLPNGTIRLAATSNFRFTAYPAADPTGNVISLDFNGSTGVMVPQSNRVYRVAPPPNGVSCGTIPSGTEGGAAGCAISPNGERIYITMESSLDCITWTPLFGYVDVATEQFTDLNATVGVPMAFMNSRIIRDRSVNSSAEALYLLDHLGNIGMVEDYAGSAPTFSIASTLSARAPVYPIPPTTGGTVLQRFLNPAVERDNHLSASSKAQCCTYFETVPGAAVEGYTHSTFATTTWNGVQNDLQPGNSTIVFTCDVIVGTGTKLLVNNMEWRFVNNARLIVQQGGFLRLRNSTLTGLECDDQRWPGVQVHGSPAASQQGFGQFQVPLDQGKIELINTTVSNAHIGVFTGTLDVTIFGVLYNLSNDGGGAVVLGLGATFLNCATGVDMRKYEAPTVQGQPTPLNLSRFINTRFVVDRPNLSSLYPFKRHVRLDRVNGVLFRQCDLRNDVADAEYESLGSAALGYGIESYQSLFHVLPGCSVILNAGEECPAEHLLPTTFTGLDHGIHAIGGPNALRNFTVDAARFTDNICGVYTSGVIGFVTKRSIFEIGGRGVPQTNPLESPLWQDFHRGVYSYNGYGFTVQDNTLSRSVHAGNDIRTEGVVIGYSKDHNDVVFRNTGANLLRGFVGEGVCASLAPSYTPVIGLQLKCNINQNNDWNLVSRKANDEDDDLQDLHTIRANQGESNLPMDNQFDGWDGTNDKWDFLVTTTYTPISYWHRNSGVDPFVPQVSSDPVIAAQNFLMNPQQVIVTPTNTCNKRIQRLPGLSDGLSPGEVKEFIETEKIAYGTTRYLYDQLIDGGSTDEVVQEITDAWPQDAWDLRAYLMSKSPYLSTSVLKDLNAQNKLPQAMYVEVCAANPDATKADGFTAWLKSEAPHPLPDYMVATIEDSWNVRTYRTNLELTMADRHASMSQAGNLLIEVYSGDTVYDPQDSLRMLWQEIRTPAARYAEAIAWMQRGEFDFARNLVAGIPQEHTKLREKELSERDRMLALIDLLKAFDQADRELDELTLAEQDQLESISQGSSDRAATWAQNLLCFHYERCAAPYTGEAGDGGPKARALVNEVEPSDVDILTISPNPSATWSAVYIVLSNTDDHASLVVMDLAGKVVQRHRLAHATQQVVLDTRGLAPGAYLVELRSDRASLAQEKLIVQP